MKLAHFDTHQFVKNFIEASKIKNNSPEKQAEVIADSIINAQDAFVEDLATKGDIELHQKDIYATKQDLMIQMREMENRLLVRIPLIMGFILVLLKIVDKIL